MTKTQGILAGCLAAIGSINVAAMSGSVSAGVTVFVLGAALVSALGGVGLYVADAIEKANKKTE